MNAGKKDYFKERTAVSCFFLFLFSLSVLGQTARNNFSLFNTITTDAGYGRINVVDFNGDRVSEFILYGIDRKRFSIHRSLRNGTLSNAKSKFFFYPLTEIKKLKNRKSFGAFYIVLSESYRLAALTSFTKYGTLLMLNKHKFYSSPSEMIITDFDQDSLKEAYIFGKNFTGISRLDEENFILRENRMVEDGIYTLVSTADINYDNIPDLVAYELLENQLKFFRFPDSSGFSVTRSVRLPFAPKTMSIRDINADNFVDLVFTDKSSLYFYSGDSVSSFENYSSLSLPFETKKSLLFDFNNDSFEDILLLSKEGDLYFILNSKGALKQPDLISAKNGITDITVKNNSLYLLSKDGFIYKKETLYSGEFYSMLLANKIPVNSSPDLLPALNSVLLLNNSGTALLLSGKKMNRLFKFTTADNFNRYIYLSAENKDIFLLYKNDGKLINIVSYDKNSKKTEKRTAFLPLPISGMVPLKFKNDAVFASELKDSSGITKTLIYKIENESLAISLIDSAASKNKRLNIALNKDYSPAYTAVGSALLKGNRADFFWKGKRTASLWLDERLSSKIAKTDYYENPHGDQFLFLFSKDEKSLYLIKKEKDKNHPLLKKLIDSISINNYIVCNYYNNLVLLFNSNRLDAVKLLLIK